VVLVEGARPLQADLVRLAVKTGEKSALDGFMMVLVNVSSKE